MYIKKLKHSSRLISLHSATISDAIMVGHPKLIFFPLKTQYMQQGNQITPLSAVV